MSGRLHRNPSIDGLSHGLCETLPVSAASEAVAMYVQADYVVNVYNIGGITSVGLYQVSLLSIAPRSFTATSS